MVQAPPMAYEATMTTWRRHIEPFTRPLFFAVSRLTRGMTLGVRVVARDKAGRIMLVRHTYLQVCPKGFPSATRSNVLSVWACGLAAFPVNVVRSTTELIGENANADAHLLVYRFGFDGLRDRSVSAAAFRRDDPSRSFGSHGFTGWGPVGR